MNEKNNKQKNTTSTLEKLVERKLDTPPIELEKCEFCKKDYMYCDCPTPNDEHF